MSGLITPQNIPASRRAPLKGLRNYITHTQLPVVQSNQAFGWGAFDITFTLSGEPLIGWSGWNGKQRAWISGQGDAVAVVDTVDAYACKAGGFDNWLFDRIALKYGADIEVYLRECVEFNRERGRVFGG